MIQPKKRTRGEGGGPKSQEFCERNKWMPHLLQREPLDVVQVGGDVVEEEAVAPVVAGQRQAEGQRGRGGQDGPQRRLRLRPPLPASVGTPLDEGPFLLRHPA